MSKAKNMAAYIATLLSDIRTANGYSTEIGRLVLRGRRSLEDRHNPCVVLHEGDDTPKDDTLKNVILRQEYIVEAHHTCDPDNPNDIAHDMIADIKKAIWKDPTWGGAVRQIYYRGRGMQPREDGLTVVSAFVRFAVEYADNLQNP